MSAFQILTFATQQALDTAANVLSGATMTFSLTGTSTPTNAYADKDLTTPLANPLSADAAGNFVAVFLDPTIVYRVVLKTSAGVTLKTWDPANENVLAAIDSEFIGLTLDSLKRTDAEISAGVTPVNYAYAPGHFHRYGASGDNSTDDSSSVQAAFNSGAVVTGIPGKTYYCGTTTISIPANAKASLYGVALRTAVNGATFLNCTGDNIEILGAEIYGRGNSSAVGSEILLAFSGANSSSYRSGLLLKDCYLHDVGFYAVYSAFGADVDILSNYFDNIAYAAVLANSPRNWRVNGNQITDITPGSSGNAYGISFSRDDSATGVATFPVPIDCEANHNVVQNITAWEALDCHSGERITFSNNLIVNCKFGINMSPIPAVPIAPRDITVVGNVIVSGSVSSDPGRAIGSGGYDSTHRATNIVVSGNVVRGYGINSNEEGALMFQYTDGLMVIGNVIEDSRASGICLFIANDSFVVSGNAVRGVRNGVANAASLNIRNTTQTGHVAGNYFDATAEIGMFIANSNPGVSFGSNRVITSGSLYSSALYAGAGFEMEGSTTTDVASIANGAQAQFNITVAGAELGDYVAAITCSISTAALSLTATVTAADTVTAVLQNNTGGAVDLASATYTALVRKR